MMRRILFLFVLCSTLNINAQVPFVYYEPVPNYQVNPQGVIVPIESNPFGNNVSKPTKQKTTFPIVGGYTKDSNGKLKRVKIQVNSQSSFLGGVSVYLRGTYNPIYSIWQPCNTQATKVDEYMDGEFISNNFEWKVSSIAYGTIYFNY